MFYCMWTTGNENTYINKGPLPKMKVYLKKFVKITNK